MSNDHLPVTSSKVAIARLAQPPLVTEANPIAARFVYSLRLIALHKKARRDPVPELAARLNSIDVTVKALALAQSISALWPENLHISRFCCCKLTHDEATIVAMIEGALGRDRPAFDRAIAGLIRPERGERLWEGVLGLVETELQAH